MIFMKIIGLIGLIGSGKDVVSDYIAKNYGYNVVVMGDIVREIAAALGRTHDRHDLIKTQKECVEKYGMDYFSKKVVEKIRKNNWQKAVINGIRRPEDATVPKKIFGDEMVIALVDAKPETRFMRMQGRKRIGDPQTFDEFLIQEKKEMKSFRLDETIGLAEYKIRNEGTLEDLYKNIDDFMKMHNLA